MNTISSMSSTKTPKLKKKSPKKQQNSIIGAVPSPNQTPDAYKLNMSLEENKYNQTP